MHRRVSCLDLDVNLSFESNSRREEIPKARATPVRRKPTELPIACNIIARRKVYIVSGEALCKPVYTGPAGTASPVWGGIVET